MDKLKSTFTAYVPDRANAISIHGNGGGNILLEFSDSEIAEALKLVAMRGKLIKVILEEVETPKKVVKTPVKSKRKKTDETAFID